MAKRQLLVITLGITGCLGILALRRNDSSFLKGAIPNHLQDFVTLSVSIIIESLPFIILGVLISILVQVWLPNNFIMRLLPKWPPLRRVCISFLGVLFPVCECGNVPLARGLLQKGFTVPESLVFLLAAPILNPITIITTIQAFGGDTSILIGRMVGGFMIANVIGLIYSFHSSPRTLLTENFARQCEATPILSGYKAPLRQKWTASVVTFRREASVILPVLFIAAAIAGAVQVVVPREILIALGSNPAWSIIAMMLLAFIVSICSNVDAFFALAFKSSFTPGSLVSFMTVGPIVDIKMLALMRTTYKTSVLVSITLITVLIAGGIGLVVNYAF